MAINNTKKEVIEKVVSKTSLNRIAKPEEIAKVISFLKKMMLLILLVKL